MNLLVRPAAKLHDETKIGHKKNKIVPLLLLPAAKSQQFCLQILSFE